MYDLNALFFPNELIVLSSLRKCLAERKARPTTGPKASKIFTEQAPLSTFHANFSYKLSYQHLHEKVIAIPQRQFTAPYIEQTPDQQITEAPLVHPGGPSPFTLRLKEKKKDHNRNLTTTNMPITIHNPQPAAPALRRPRAVDIDMDVASDSDSDSGTGGAAIQGDIPMHDDDNESIPQDEDDEFEEQGDARDEILTPGTVITSNSQWMRYCCP
jgi:hypothetical protein